MKTSAAFPLRRALLDTAILTALTQFVLGAIECFQGAVHFSTQPGLKVNTLRWFNQAEFVEVKLGESQMNFSKSTTLCCATSRQCRKLPTRTVQNPGKLSKGSNSFYEKKTWSTLQVNLEWKPCNAIWNKLRCLTLTWKGLNPQTQHHSEDSSTCHSPTQNDNEVHHVPAVPQVRALVECKSQSNDFYSSF